MVFTSGAPEVNTPNESRMRRAQVFSLRPACDPCSRARCRDAGSGFPPGRDRASQLEPGRAVNLKKLKLNAGLATLRLDDGVLVPIEMVFLGSGRIEFEPRDAVEAGQLELFTGGARLDQESQEAAGRRPGHPARRFPTAALSPPKTSFRSSSGSPPPTSSRSPSSSSTAPACRRSSTATDEAPFPSPDRLPSTPASHRRLGLRASLCF